MIMTTLENGDLESKQKFYKNSALQEVDRCLLAALDAIRRLPLESQPGYAVTGAAIKLQLQIKTVGQF